METLKNEFGRIEALIAESAEKYNSETEEWLYEEIELDTFSEIVKFALIEGSTLNEESCKILLDNDDYNEEREFEILRFDGMVNLTIQFDERTGIKPMSLDLYDKFRSQFYYRDEQI